MRMLFLFLFVLIVIVVCSVLVWSRPDGSPVLGRRSTAAELTGSSPAVHPDGPESLEGVLVVQLMSGKINRGQYLHAVEGIAARDDERHPLTVPPETGPADV